MNIKNFHGRLYFFDKERVVFSQQQPLDVSGGVGVGHDKKTGKKGERERERKKKKKKGS